MMKKGIRADLWIIFSIILVYLILAIPNLYYTDLHCDEADPGIFGINFLMGKEIADASSVSIRFCGKRFPVDQTQSYAFALPSYLLIPFFILFGINVVALKFLGITLAIVSLAALYYICIVLFNRRIAVLTVFLLSISSVFVFSTRVELRIGENMLNSFFWVSVAFFILYFRKKASIVYFCLGCLLFGMGFSIKLSFLARALGLFFAAILIFPKGIGFCKLKFKIRHIFIAIICFCLGAFLFIYYNVMTKGETFRLVRYFSAPTEIGVNNLDFKANFNRRLSHFNAIVNEDVSHFDADGILDNLKPRLNKNIMLIIFWVALGFNLLFLFRKDRLEIKKVLFIYITYIGMFFTSLFTPFSSRTFHLLVIEPIPAFTLALFLNNIYGVTGRFRNKKVFKRFVIPLIFATILGPFLITDVDNLIFYHSTLRKTGGAYLGPVRYEVVDYILSQKIDENKIFSMAHFWLDVAPFITHGKKKNFNYSLPETGDMSTFSSDAYADRLKDVLGENDEKIYFLLCLDPSMGYSEKYSILQKGVNQLNKKIRLEQVFYNKIREPQYNLYCVE
ncbi:MAG: glycosyltransferase family 39 protein [Candidatus Omnitrophota bacterium]